MKDSCSDLLTFWYCPLPYRFNDLMRGSNAFVFTVVDLVDSWRVVALLQDHRFREVGFRVILVIEVELQRIRTIFRYFSLGGKISKQVVLFLKINLNLILPDRLLWKDVMYSHSLRKLLYHIIDQLAQYSESKRFGNALSNKTKIFLQYLPKSNYLTFL